MTDKVIVSLPTVRGNKGRPEPRFVRGQLLVTPGGNVYAFTKEYRGNEYGMNIRVNECFGTVPSYHPKTWPPLPDTDEGILAALQADALKDGFWEEKIKTMVKPFTYDLFRAYWASYNSINDLVIANHPAEVAYQEMREAFFKNRGVYTKAWDNAWKEAPSNLESAPVAVDTGKE